MMLMLEALLLFSVGLIAGVMNAIAGGGMMLGFPAMLASGLSPIAATATAYIITAPGLFAAIVSYRKYLKKIPGLYWYLLIPCIAGAAIGSLILKNTSAEAFERYVPMLLAIAVAIFIAQPYMHFHFHNHLTRRTKRLLPIILIGILMFPLAIYGGFFGIGFGFAMLAFLSFTKLHSIHKISALKNIAALTIIVTSSLVLLDSGLIDWHTALVMGAGCTIGGYYGATLAQRFSSHTVRIAVIAIGIAAVGYLFIKYY